MPRTVNVYIDHNLGGIAKDTFVMPDRLDAVETAYAKRDDSRGILRDLPLDEARAILLAAFEATDSTWQPPVEDTFSRFRALSLARIRTLPEGFVLPDRPEVTEQDRDALVGEFLASANATKAALLFDADVAEHLAEQILRYSTDYVTGEQLRFSPTMAEIFCVDWAPRKLMADREDLANLPALLKAWVPFVDERREVVGDATAATQRSIDRSIVGHTSCKQRMMTNHRGVRRNSWPPPWRNGASTCWTTRRCRHLSTRSMPAVASIPLPPGHPKVSCHLPRYVAGRRSNIAPEQRKANSEQRRYATR